MNKISHLVNKGGKGLSVIVVAAVLVLGASVWSWWHFVRSNPERTFYAAINNNLRTSGVSRQIEQGGAGQNLKQHIDVNTTAHHVAHGVTTINQSGAVDATIETETYSSPQTDYVRYTKIDTNQKNAKGKPIDFSKLVNIWGKSGAASFGQTTGQLYSESVLGVVPTGNMTASARTKLMEQIRSKKVYKYNEKKIEQVIRNGRPVYIYEVSVKPEPYVAMLKQFAQDIGMTQLDSVDPAQYKNAQPLKFKLTVDVWSRHLADIDYTGAGRNEKLGGYGVVRDVELPTKTIPMDKLQQKLQAAQ